MHRGLGHRRLDLPSGATVPSIAWRSLSPPLPTTGGSSLPSSSAPCSEPPWTCSSRWATTAPPCATSPVAPASPCPASTTTTPTKQEMLTTILDLRMEDLLWRSRAAQDEGGGDPVRRFELLIECLVLYHTYRRDLAFMGASEMRNLDPGNRRRLVVLRGEQQRMVDEAVDEAVASGRFTTPYPRVRGAGGGDDVHRAPAVVPARRPTHAGADRRAVRAPRPRHRPAPAPASCSLRLLDRATARPRRCSHRPSDRSVGDGRPNAAYSGPMQPEQDSNVGGDRGPGTHGRAAIGSTRRRRRSGVARWQRHQCRDPREPRPTSMRRV